MHLEQFYLHWIHTSRWLYTPLSISCLRTGVQSFKMKSCSLNIHCCSLSNHKVAETVIKQNKSKCTLQNFLEEILHPCTHQAILHKKSGMQNSWHMVFHFWHTEKNNLPLQQMIFNQNKSVFLKILIDLRIKKKPEKPSQLNHNTAAELNLWWERV